MKEGTVMTVEFTLEGIEFLALNGGPIFKFTEAISFIINCETQEEIDKYWYKLIDGGDKSAQQCGWLKDKFGLSWQVSTPALGEMLSQGDPEKSGRIMNAMMKMKKIDIYDLQKAFTGDQ